MSPLETAMFMGDLGDRIGATRRDRNLETLMSLTGGLAAKGDYAGASQQLMRGGQLDAGLAMQQHGEQRTQMSQAQAREAGMAALGTLRQLRAVPESDRSMIAPLMAQQLAKFGIDTSQFDFSDLTDAGIDQDIMALAQLEGPTEPRTPIKASPGDTFLDPTTMQPLYSVPAQQGGAADPQKPFHFGTTGDAAYSGDPATGEITWSQAPGGDGSFGGPLGAPGSYDINSVGRYTFGGDFTPVDFTPVDPNRGPASSSGGVIPQRTSSAQSTYDTTFARETARDDAGFYSTAQQRAQSAAQTIQSLDEAQALLDSGAAVGPGAGGRIAAGQLAAVSPAGGVASNLPGIPTAGETSALNNFRRLTSRMTIADAASLKGAMSDKDLAFLQSATLSADAPEQSNREAISLMRWASERQIAYAQFLTRWLEAGGRVADFDSSFLEWADEAMPMPSIGSVGGGRGGPGDAPAPPPGFRID